MKDTLTYRLLAEAFEQSPTLLAILDREFRFVHVNEAYAASTRRPVAELIGAKHFDLFPHEENEAIFRKLVESGEVYSVQGKPFDHPDQPERKPTYWDWQLVPISEDGRVEHVILMLRDVTDETLLKRELHNNYETLKSVFEQTALVVVRTDREFRHLFANEAYFSLFGIEPERCIGKTAAETALPESFSAPWRTHHREAVEARAARSFNFRIADGHDGERYFRGDISPEYDVAGQVRSFITIITEVTVMKQREEELENLLVEMNHRIKNNLANIEALARVELEVGEKTKRDAIEDIVSRIQAIGQVHQTLYATRSYSRVRIGPYITNLVRSLIESATIDAGTPVEPRITADKLDVTSKVATKLGLILAELTTNTLKYAHCSSVCEITVGVTVDDDGVMVTYSDSGDKFGDGITGIDDLKGGTGMMIVEALVSDLDGTIALDTTKRPPPFVIRFPYSSTQ